MAVALEIIECLLCGIGGGAVALLVFAAIAKAVIKRREKDGES